jgi:hypothetical protein
MSYRCSCSLHQLLAPGKLQPQTTWDKEIFVLRCFVASARWRWGSVGRELFRNYAGRPSRPCLKIISTVWYFLSSAWKYSSCRNNYWRYQVHSSRYFPSCRSTIWCPPPIIRRISLPWRRAAIIRAWPTYSSPSKLTVHGQTHLMSLHVSSAPIIAGCLVSHNFIPIPWFSFPAALLLSISYLEFCSFWYYARSGGQLDRALTCFPSFAHHGRQALLDLPTRIRWWI